MMADRAAQQSEGNLAFALLLLRIALKTRKRLIVVIFVLTSVATLIAVYARRPNYESSAAILVNVERVGVSSSHIDLKQDAALLTAVEAVTSQAEVLRSRELIERVVDRLDPNIFKPQRPRNPLLRFVSDSINTVLDAAGDALRAIALIPPRDRRFETVQRIERNLEVSTIRQTQVIRLNFQASTAEAANMVLRELLNIYQTQAAGRRLNSDEPKLFFQEAERAKRELEDVENKLFALRRQYHIVDLATEKAQISERLNTLIMKAEGAQDAAKATPATLLPEAATNSGADQPRPAADSFVLADATNDSASGVSTAQIMHLRSQITALRIERSALLSTYTADYPRVLTIDRQLATTDALLQQEIGKLVETINSYRARLDKLIEIEPTVTRLMRSASLLTNSYDAYYKAAEDRKIMRQQDARLEVEVIDQPSMPYAPRGPLPVWLVAGGMAGGLLLGLATALGVTYLQLHRHKIDFATKRR
jgi:uncharacterized protein involved in exopolysaccharide biosynthesis